MLENTDQNNSEYGHFLRSVEYVLKLPLAKAIAKNIAPVTNFINKIDTGAIAFEIAFAMESLVVFFYLS